MGHPGESIKTLNDTVNLATKINTDTLAVGIMVPYPGSKVYKMAQNNEGGLRLISKDWSRYDKYGGNVLEINHLPRNTLEYFQFKTYIFVYILNLRIIDFIKHVWSYKQVVKHLLKSWLDLLL